MGQHVWDYEDVIDAGKSFFDRLKSDLKAARQRIDIETYIFRNDELGRSIIELLNSAVKRGVKVRFMVDGIGSSFWSLKYIENNLDPRIQFRIYHPLPWFLFFARRLQFGLRPFLRFLMRINRRNHRKTCLIDGRIAYVGSMNICKDSLVWRDTGARVEGSQVACLESSFSAIFNEKALTRRASELVRTNTTRKMRRRLYEDFLDKISRASEKIWITSAYFIPHWRVVLALCRAAKRGVDVKILVPKFCDVKFIPLVRAVYYAGFLESGVKIFEYLPKMLHAKTIIIDDWAMVGSSNLNHRSLHYDLEADIVLTKSKSRETLVTNFQKDLKFSLNVSNKDLKRLTWLENKSGQALYLLKNWM